ncbi:acyltransferase family protein [Marinivivus vitaminiproducens]|uniref:acyltransferase family protein n=1 Tax=Marinivivus vitaminiproducens TaxID=3035935 RepID=UPI0027A1AF23|nr:acyltransferase family protein [Geminicoccaceae bacterium SCSIO 64248]
MSTNSPFSKPSRRDDIQGLRAVGALLVAVFHIWIGRVSGGVDVFFVVSGYLLIGSLARQIERSGRVEVVTFGANLVRRLFPASLFVLAVVALLSPFVIPLTRWTPAMREIFASALYLENWQLARSAVDYLARDQLASPVQHYWAMAVQVQAMAFFALALAALGFVLRRTGLDRRKAVLGFLAAVTLASFAYAVIRTGQNQPFTYFDTLARLWEFGLGGLVAYGLAGLVLPSGLAWAGGWLGLALIVSCGFALEVSTGFPGWAALWPTLGACLVLLCCRSDRALSAGRLLASPPLRWVGDHSYALYLWHWPLLIFYLSWIYETHAGLVDGLVILALSLLLAWATTRLVETPFRTRRAGGPFATFAGGACAIAVILAGVLGWNMYGDARRAEQQLTFDDPGRYPGARAFDGAGTQGRLPVLPGPLYVRLDRPASYDTGCHQDLDGAEPISCGYGASEGAPTLALVGGSHAAQWLPGLVEALKGTPWRIVTFTKSACLFSVTDPGQDESYKDACAEWNANVMARLQAIKPAAVFTTSTRTATGEEIVPAGYVETWDRLKSWGIDVIGVRDTPWMGFDVAECVDVKGRDHPVCNRPRDVMLARQDPLDAIARLDSLKRIDLTRYFCDERTCPPVAGNVMIYYDTNHVSATYMRTLADDLRERLMPLLDRYEQASGRRERPVDREG